GAEKRAVTCRTPLTTPSGLKRTTCGDAGVWAARRTGTASTVASHATDRTASAGRATDVTRASETSGPTSELEGLDVDARRPLRVRHVRPHALARGDRISLRLPLGALGDLGMLELVERQIRRRAAHRAIPAATDHAGHLLVVRHVDRAVPGVPLGIDRGGD